MTNDDLKQKVFALITKCEITGDGDDTCYFGAEEITDLITAEMAARIEALSSNHFAGVSPDSISREAAIKAVRGG